MIARDPLRAWSAIAAGLLAAGCSGGEREGGGLDCFPKEAARWLASDEPLSGFEGARESDGPVAVYVDASGSMVGYLAGATKAERPFHDLVASLPDMFSAARSSVTYRSFGSRIRPIDASQQAKLLQEDYYRCRNVPAAECDNQETRLDLVLREVEAQKSGLAIIITDMWFADPASVTSGLVPMAAPLENILASGRSVGVYGIAAPFAGTIYDLPLSGPVRFTGKRPLVMLAIGPNERVRQFGEQLARSPSAFLARGIQDGSIRQSIFTLDPSSGVARSTQPLTSGADPRVAPATILEAIKGVRVQQFRLQRQGALREAQQATELPSWRGPDDKGFIEKAVWRGPLATRTLVWQRRGERCSPTDWSDPEPFTGGWEAAQQGGQKNFKLDPVSFAQTFRRPGVYLLTGEIARTSLDQPNPATAWLRDWSFHSAQGVAEATRGDAGFFRTLNLAEFARLLENSLAEAAERKPGPIAGFTVAVEVKD